MYADTSAGRRAEFFARRCAGLQDVFEGSAGVGGGCAERRCAG